VLNCETRGIIVMDEYGKITKYWNNSQEGCSYVQWAMTQLH
jgi:hypothetical protein